MPTTLFTTCNQPARSEILVAPLVRMAEPQLLKIDLSDIDNRF